MAAKKPSAKSATAKVETSTKRASTKKASTKKASTKKAASRLERPRWPMPVWVKEALASRGLTERYEDRPDYQQNDYVWWITSAKLEATRNKRLEQMLAELEAGDVYMNMRWTPQKVRA